MSYWVVDANIAIKTALDMTDSLEDRVALGPNAAQRPDLGGAQAAPAVAIEVDHQALRGGREQLAGVGAPDIGELRRGPRRRERGPGRPIVDQRSASLAHRVDRVAGPAPDAEQIGRHA